MIRVSLLGQFRLSLPGTSDVALSRGAQRVLALLALRKRTLKRSVVAGTLWPDASQERANTSLRAALCRLHNAARGAVRISAADLGLGADAAVDVDETAALARRLLNPAHEPCESELGSEAIRALGAELLPDWYEEWVLPEAESWRQLRLRTLESLADRLVSAGRFGDATTAALAAVAAEPLRETSRAALIRVHLAEGNQSEAVREYRGYQALLRAELGLAPTAKLRELVQTLGVS